MDGSSLGSQAVRLDQLQRLLKQYELESPNSLRGPATLTGASTAAACSSILGSSTTPSANASRPQAPFLAGSGHWITPEMELAAFATLSNAASKHAQQKMSDGATSSSLASSTNPNKREHSNISATEERALAIDRSALQQQETLLKEILALKGAIPVQPLPVLTSRDRTPSAAERKETLLEGEIITCFVVGGEKRLCLQQVLNTVLKNVPMVDINKACAELNIHCGHCTPEQLLALKIAGVVSATTASCALITKTDAERLCDYLLRQRRNYGGIASLTLTSQVDKKCRTGAFVAQSQGAGLRLETDKGAMLNGLSSSRQHPSESNTKTNAGISVVHFCFGWCRGRYFPSLYASPSAECIECDECRSFFAPDRFVVHSHGNQERRTCHWGFDSANWRAYLHLSEDCECEENAKTLDDMKLRFDFTGLTKRRSEPEIGTGGCKPANLSEADDTQPFSKRLKLDAVEQHSQRQNSSAATASALEEANAKLPLPAALASAVAIAPNLPDLDQLGLPYLLCNPFLLAIYYQAALTTIRAANATQTSSAAENTIAPSLLPHLATVASLQTSQPTQQPGASLSSDGFAVRTGQPRHRDLQHLTREGPLDEATAVAALKLLQMHGSGNGDTAFADLMKTGSLGRDHKLTGQSESGKHDYAAAVKFHEDVPTKPAPTATTCCKEPFKKQLLHLFAVEQQQKEEQRRQQEEQRKESPKSIDLHPRRPAEAIADDEHGCDFKRQPVTERLRPLASSSESEKQEGGAATPDTQVADELSVSSSDNEGASGELSLDDLLRQYITDSNGLKLVRIKIAENQRYLEQKLDAVSAENRVLHAEWQQLRMRYMEQCQQQEKREQANAAATNILVRDAVGNFTGLLPTKPYVQ